MPHSSGAPQSSADYAADHDGTMKAAGGQVVSSFGLKKESMSDQSQRQNRNAVSGEGRNVSGELSTQPNGQNVVTLTVGSGAAHVKQSTA